ncbi:hypothetical protein C9J85_19820 [Haloferax sp. wsp5]|nr:hypothetical protein C9J85_19820 [Haloferax sp. wsp5]
MAAEDEVHVAPGDHVVLKPLRKCARATNRSTRVRFADRGVHVSLGWSRSLDAPVGAIRGVAGSITPTNPTRWSSRCPSR